MKVHKGWIAALTLVGASGLAMAGPGCDEKWAKDDGLHDEVPPKVATKADTTKAATAAKDARKDAAKTAKSGETAKVAQTR